MLWHDITPGERHNEENRDGGAGLQTSLHTLTPFGEEPKETFGQPTLSTLTSV
jgi:hypothetical protein